MNTRYFVHRHNESPVHEQAMQQERLLEVLRMYCMVRVNNNLWLGLQNVSFKVRMNELAANRWSVAVQASAQRPTEWSVLFAPCVALLLCV